MQTEIYRGTLIKELGAQVERISTRYELDTLCENCFEPQSAHGAFDDSCPVAWPEPMGQRKFSPLLCDFVDPRSREVGEHCHSAGVVVVGDAIRCLKHFGMAKGEL